MPVPPTILHLVSFGSGSVRDREFLPAALEVTETPPNPLGRLTELSLCLVTVAG
jgi:HlyD family secretion protein/hemolysin D